MPGFTQLLKTAFGLCGQDGKVANGRMDFAEYSQSKNIKSCIPDLQQDIDDGGMRVRSQKDRFAVCDKNSDDASDRCTFACARHAQDQGVILCGHDFLNSSLLIGVHLPLPGRSRKVVPLLEGW